MSAIEMRMFRLEHLQQTVRDNGGKMGFTDLYVEMSKFGIARRTFLEYLSALRMAKKITLHAYGKELSPLMRVIDDRIEIVLVAEAPK